MAQQEAQKRHQRRDHADDAGRPPDARSQQGETQPHGQRVDAGGQRQPQKGQAPAGIDRFFRGFRPFPAVQCLEKHMAANGGQKGKGNPVAEALHKGAQRQPGRLADDGHQRLKQTKVKKQPETGPESQGPDMHAGRQGHGKGIHCQGECQR